MEYAFALRLHRGRYSAYDRRNGHRPIGGCQPNVPSRDDVPVMPRIERAGCAPGEESHAVHQPDRWRAAPSDQGWRRPAHHWRGGLTAFLTRFL